MDQRLVLLKKTEESNMRCEFQRKICDPGFGSPLFRSAELDRSPHMTWEK